MQSNANTAPENGRPPSSLTAAESVRRGLMTAGLQLAALIAFSIIFAVFDLDRSISAHFFDPDEKWFMGRDRLWSGLYQYGTIPGAILAIGCLAGWLISFFNGRLTAWRPYFLLVVLTTVIAAGILVNSVFKPYWGRPRPNQTTDFGGYYTYRHVFPPGTPGKGASFPCGHCAMGFTFLALYFARRRSKVIAYSGAAAGIILGCLLSAARIINGAHFTSDAVWSLGIVSMTMVLLHDCVLKIPAKGQKKEIPRFTGSRKSALVAGVCIALLLMVGAFMTRRPFFKTNEYPLSLTRDTKRIQIEINIDPEKLWVRYDNRLMPALLIHAHGFGWAWVDYRIERNVHASADGLHWQFQVKAQSYFSELDHTVEVILPENAKDQVDIELIPNPQLSLSDGPD